MGEKLKQAVLLAALIVCFCFVPGGFGAWAQEQIYDGDAHLVLDAQYGYQGIAKSGRFLPLTAQVSNQGEQDFSGVLSVLCMESDYSVYRYEYPVEIPAGGSIEREMNISLGTGIDQLYLAVEDQEGNQQAKKRLKLTINPDTAELFIGVLSDNPDRLQYLNGVGINYGTLRTRVIDLSSGAMPVRETELDQLDVLLITSYDTSQLEEPQIETIWDWVYSGGLLLLGTGARADTLSAFQDQILAAPLSPAEYEGINMGLEFAKDGPEGATISLMCTDVLMPEAQEVLSSDEVSVLTYISAGQGRVAASIYDFADPEIEDFCRQNLSYIDNLFTQLLGEEWIERLSIQGDGTASGEFWSVQGLINTGDINRLPNVPMYVAVAAFYLLLAGPGLYLLLKRRKLRMYYSRFVLALSLCCTGIIYLMGIGTRFRAPFFTYATIRDADSHEVVETTFINMRSPYNRTYSVELDPSYDLYPITRSAYYDMASVPDFTGSEPADIVISRWPERTEITARDTGAFHSKYFRLEKRTSNEEQVGFTGQVSLFGTQVSGTLTNNYKQAVENVAILFYNQMVLVDRMEPGETVDLDGRQVISGIMSFSYAMAEQITGASRYAQGDIQDRAYVQSLEQTSLLSFYISNYLSGYRQEAQVVGFSTERQQGSFLGENNYETYGSTLLTSTIEVNHEQDGRVYRSGLQKEPEVLSGTYDYSSNTMNGSAPLILEYYLGNDTEVQSLEFVQLSEPVLESLTYSYIVPFTGNMYFYNYDTGSYDVMNLEVYDRKTLEPYLSPGNTLTVKYVYDNVQNYSWNIMLPLLNVVGGN